LRNCFNDPNRIPDMPNSFRPLAPPDRESRRRLMTPQPH
jgi:hypothetical protein